MINSLQPLCDLIANHENWLIYRVLEDIRQLDDNHDKFILIEAVQIVIPELSLVLKEAIQNPFDLQKTFPDFDYTQKAISCSLKIRTQQNRHHNVSLSLMQNLLELCRQSYLKLLDKNKFSTEQIKNFTRLINQCFEELKIDSFKQEWLNQLETDEITRLQTIYKSLNKKKLTNKTDFYISNNPIFLFDKNNKIIKINRAATKILMGSENIVQGLSFVQKELDGKLSWLKKQIEQFSCSNQLEKRSKVLIKTKINQQEFEVIFKRIIKNFFWFTIVIFKKIENLLEPEKKGNLVPSQQAENTLRLKEFVIASSINAIALMDLDGNFTYVNQAFLEMWRYDDIHEVLQKSFLNFWQIRKQATTVIKAICERDKWIGELVGKRKDGNLFDAQISANIVKNQANIAICMMVSVMDITQQKAAEKSLQKLLRLYTNLTQAAPVGIFRTDKDGKCIYANEKALLMAGISLDKALGTGWANYLHKEDQKRVLNQWVKAVQTQTSFRTESRYTHSNGNSIWVLAQATPETDEYGEIVGYLGTLTDITERKNAEEATSKINAEMQAIFDAFPDILFRIDEKGTILDYKTQDYSSLYFSPEEFIGKKIQEVLPEPVGNSLYQGVRQALLSGQVVSIEYSLTITFQKRFFDARIVRLTPFETIAVVRDISDRKHTELALREAQERLRTIILTNPDGLVILDPQGKVLFVNPAAESLFDRKVEDLIGEVLGIPIVLNNSSEIEILQPTGKLVITRIQLVKIIWEEQIAFLASLVDVTDLRQAQEQLKILYQATEQSPVSVVITDAEGKIEYVNAKFEQITGYARQEVIGQNPRILKSGEMYQEEYEQLWQTITLGQEWHGEFHNKKKNGEVFWEAASISPIKNEEGIITHFVGIKEDITQRKTQEAILAYQANYDSLTGLPNRFLAIDRLKQAILQAEREKKRVAVMFIDLDHFKDVNDTLGHEYGDVLLQQVSERLRKCLRKSDTVARLGGDEFLIIISHLKQPSHCKVISTKILSALEKPFNLLGEEAFISASIGITLYPDDGNDVNVLMRNADTAMYLSKRGGRNEFNFYTMGMNEAALTRVRLENLLRHALKKNELYIVYQPIIEFNSGKVVGAEALLRWNNSELGQINPDQFIPIAEETGLINELGAWVISQACQEVVNWQVQETPIWVAVNLSPRQFRESKLVKIITDAIADNGITNHCLELEITEKLLLEDFPGSKGIINQLHQMDFRLSIDDFGTGYSALSYLMKFSFNRLKIDRSFITDLSHNQEALGLVKTIIAMGHALKLQVIAEGVETSEQADILKAEGCDYAQGYFFSPPIPSEEFRGYLQFNQNIQFPINLRQ